MPKTALLTSMDTGETIIMNATEYDEKTAATETLLRLFPAGATVHTLVRHVSSSGMTRSISVLAIDGGEIRDVSWLVARTGLFQLSHSTHGQGGLKVTGAGMDMTFHVTYSLSMQLHGDGYALTNRML